MSQLQRRLVTRVRDLTGRKGLTLSELPELAGVARSHFFDVLRLEKSPTLAWLERIARALDVDVAQLLKPLEDEAAFVNATQDDRGAVPLLTLADAVHGNPPTAWVTPKTKRRMRKSHFVTQVFARAMAPLIPERAYVIFETQAHDLLADRVVLVQHPDISDPELGGSYTIRLYERQRGAVVLRAEDESFAPITFSIDAARQLRVIAELFLVLPTS